MADIGNQISQTIKNATGFGNAPDAYTLIMNIGGSLGSISLFIYALAYMLSLWMLFLTINKLAKYGESSNNNEQGLGSIFIGFGLCVLLYYLPSTLDSISLTVFNGTGSAFAYTAASGVSAKVAAATTVIYRFIGIAGVAAVIIGIMSMKAVSEGSSRDGYSKGVWHVIGGWCAIHLDDLISVLKSTGGFS